MESSGFTFLTKRQTHLKSKTDFPIDAVLCKWYNIGTIKFNGDCKMKKNCQILTAEQLARKMCTIECEDAVLLSDGTLCIRTEPCGVNEFARRWMFTTDEIAQKINMPHWEVVMFDIGGFDEYALLFYED